MQGGNHTDVDKRKEVELSIRFGLSFLLSLYNELHTLVHILWTFLIINKPSPHP